MNKPELTIIDVSAIAWVIKWPTKASVINYLQAFNSYILQNLVTSNINLVFDSYYDYTVHTNISSFVQNCRIWKQ